MLNQIILVGRLVKNMENGDKYITIACPRSFKNAEGVYETDFIDCKVYDNMTSNVAEYCRKGNIIGVKGRIQSTNHDDGDGHYTKKMEIIAEKITFLSSKHSEDINA